MKNFLRQLSLALFLIIVLITLWVEKHFLPLSFLLVLLASVPFFVRFENRKIKAEEMLLIATLAAVAAVSRIPFAAIPGVQPTSFIIIMAGTMLGAEAGFMIGSTAAIVSNIFLGQGPWTPWQMMAWGLMGWSAGVLRTQWWMKNTTGMSIFGMIWGFLFGWIMNIWSVLGLFAVVTWPLILSAVAASFIFDLAHGVSNVVLITLFSVRWRKILGRMIVKFGLLDPS